MELAYIIIVGAALLIFVGFSVYHKIQSANIKKLANIKELEILYRNLMQDKWTKDKYSSDVTVACYTSTIYPETRFHIFYYRPVLYLSAELKNSLYHEYSKTVVDNFIKRVEQELDTVFRPKNTLSVINQKYNKDEI